MADKRKKNNPNVDSSTVDPIGEDGKPKVRTGFRGWVILRSNVDMALRIMKGPFTKRAGRLNHCPDRLMWPDMNDYNGAMEFISAVMDQDIDRIKFFMDQYPDYDLGIEEYVKGLEARNLAKFPGGTRVLSSQILPRQLRLDMEVATDANGVMHLRKVIRRGNKEIIAKTIARKQSLTPSQKVQVS